MKDRTQVFRYSGNSKASNIGLFEISDKNADSVKLFRNVPFHIRSVLSHSYRNIDIPRTANVYDHTIFEGNPDTTAINLLSFLIIELASEYFSTAK